MKINKNILMEYLYLTIFVITLFVLKELIEYVFFTRKRNNIIEKFSDLTPACDKIEWYYSNYANIKKIFDNISLIYVNDNDPIPQQIVIKCEKYTEIKTVTADIYSRIVLEPSSAAIYFEKFTIDAANVSVSPDSCFAIRFINDSSKEFLDFITYNYTTIPSLNSDLDSCTFNSSHHGDVEIFARFDTTVQYTENINEKVRDLMADH